LTVVHIGKYAYEGLDFVGLLEELVGKTSINRIRLSSLNPQEITDDLIALLKPDSRFCPHIHLSLQSGDDKVLVTMGRKYRRDKIIEVTERLVEALPNITIGADFIVGFPGETTEAFENTRSLIEKNNLHHLHIFPYSDRPGTKASYMEQKIPTGEKTRRTSILRNLGKSKKTDHLNVFLGRPLRVLFENREMHGDKIMTGLSENYLRVEAPFDKDCLGQIVEVTPIDMSGERLITKTITGTPISRK
jgi:threonylcarbamoyladenosine tRNA methylthiotransferase MtaB